MEEKALRLSAVFLMILTAVSFVLLPKLPALHTWEVEAREERIAEEEFAQSQVTMQNLKIKEQNEAAGAKGELSIRLPEGVTGDQIAVSNDYVTQTIRVKSRRRTALILTATRFWGTATILTVSPTPGRGRWA